MPIPTPKTAVTIPEMPQFSSGDTDLSAHVSVGSGDSKRFPIENALPYIAGGLTEIDDNVYDYVEAAPTATSPVAINTAKNRLPARHIETIFVQWQPSLQTFPGYPANWFWQRDPAVVRLTSYSIDGGTASRDTPWIFKEEDCLAFFYPEANFNRRIDFMVFNNAAENSALLPYRTRTFGKNMLLTAKIHLNGELAPTTPDPTAPRDIETVTAGYVFPDYFIDSITTTSKVLGISNATQLTFGSNTTLFSRTISWPLDLWGLPPTLSVSFLDGDPAQYKVTPVLQRTYLTFEITAEVY